MICFSSLCCAALVGAIVVYLVGVHQHKKRPRAPFPIILLLANTRSNHRCAACKLQLGHGESALSTARPAYPLPPRKRGTTSCPRARVPNGPSDLIVFFFSLLLNRLPFCPFFVFFLCFTLRATQRIRALPRGVPAGPKEERLCTLNIRGMQHGRMHVCAYALYNSARNAAKPRRGSVCSGL